MPIRSTNEDDLRNLYEDGLIDAEEFEVLNELLNNPIDVNKASRGELFDLPGLTMAMAQAIVVERRKGPYRSLEHLQARVPLVNDEVLTDIRPFARAFGGEDEAGFDWEKLRGTAFVRTGMYLDREPPLEDDNPNKTHTPEQLGYADLPATQASVDLTYSQKYGAGAVMLLQPEVRGVVYDPDDRDIDITWGPQAHLARAYAWTEQDSWSGILGHYSAGFGLGLTFDRTGRTQPNGWYKDPAVQADQLFRRFRTPKRMMGAAASFYGDVGDKRIEGTVFVSADNYDLYQYDMGMTGGEEVDWTTTESDSPRVYLDDQKVGWITLPNVYRELIAGGNVSFEPTERSAIGLTTYIARQDRDLIDGMEDDQQFVIRGGYPVLTDTFGAVGVNGAWGTGIVDLFGEAAVTLTGGTGYLVKAFLDPLGSEIEISLRHYGTNFDNPFARGVAAADQYEGFRDRDEQGARVKAGVDLTDKLRFTGQTDLWRNLSLTTTNLYLYGRLQYSPIEKRLALAAFGYRTDQNLAASGRGRVYGGDSGAIFEDLSDQGDDFDLSTLEDRSGTRSVAGLQVTGLPIKPLQLSALYQRMYTDAGLLYPTEEGPCDYWYQIGQYTWFKARYEIVDPTWITFRTRYRDEDVHGSVGERSFDWYLQLDQKIGPKWKIVARGLMGWMLQDATADFKDYCDRQGVPPLEGTCAVDPSALAEEELPAADLFGVIWASAQVRF